MFGQFRTFNHNNSTMHKQHIDNICSAQKLTLCSNKDFLQTNNTHVFCFCCLSSYHMTFATSHFHVINEKTTTKGDHKQACQ